MNHYLLDSLEYIYEHPGQPFLLFIDSKSDLERMKEFFPDVPICDGSGSVPAQQAMKAFREGKVRGLVLPKSLVYGWNVRAPENKQVAVLFSYRPEQNEYEQAQGRVHRLS